MRVKRKIELTRISKYKFEIKFENLYKNKKGLLFDGHYFDFSNSIGVSDKLTYIILKKYFGIKKLPKIGKTLKGYEVYNFKEENK